MPVQTVMLLAGGVLAGAGMFLPRGPFSLTVRLTGALLVLTSIVVMVARG